MNAIDSRIGPPSSPPLAFSRVTVHLLHPQSPKHHEFISSISIIKIHLHQKPQTQHVGITKCPSRRRTATTFIALGTTRSPLRHQLQSSPPHQTIIGTPTAPNPDHDAPQPPSKPQGSTFVSRCL
ncbi:hypothetical protein LR48_Vigan09g081600 [Vigna angularis]|uniref:Uncharacterized protein n=1 Tax=Phaseolus angularis TaxID=3914 RepID=A0A0L9VAR3_PHAAN|nr:hypothetical protein LR48_Vigan09g081500 [Vigna angularis]KOM52157.1 hypothetical protein LR48_Vigan09g081600 [Vigna angularis]